jgi:hypothetical protein
MVNMGTPRTRSSWGLAAPSRKWFAAQVTALSALAVMWATTGSWDQEETIAAIGVVSQALLAYLVPNDPQQAERP